MELDSLLQGINQIDDANNIKGFKHQIAGSYEWLEAQLAEAEISTLVLGRAKFVDCLLKKLWQLTDMQQHKEITLVAVGGYGRGHLQPHSDIDLLFLYHKRLTSQQKADISEFITRLWDLGLDIGQSVRSIKETMTQARGDITVATNLLESRLLCGCDKTFDKLTDKIQGRRFWTSQDFYQAKLDEQEARHGKHFGVAYNLEPNIKENPGGLRDIQTIGWVAKKHYAALEGKELVAHGYLTVEELQELVACRYHLWRVRCALHLVSGRSENRLLFDYQPAVAQKLGYGDDGKKSVETMMKSFFRTVRQIRELNQMLLQRFGQRILAQKVQKTRKIDGDLEIQDGYAVLTDPLYFETPQRVMQFFLLLSEQSDVKALHSNTIQLLRNARRTFTDEPWQQYPECRKIFMTLMAHPSFFGVPWDLMHKHSILQSYLAPWGNIVGMMQFDLFHAFTVDEHTNKLIKNIYYYSQAAAKEDFPRCHRIMTNLEKPELLFIAAIFHDIAKGRNGDHSVLGAQDVRVFCQLHKLDLDDSKLIEWLVENHLLMSIVAQRRDIYDPDVIQEFATKVRNKNQLNHLYALTLADIRATNDNLWNDWKASLLRELYKMTRQALEDGLECNVDLQTRSDKQKIEALNLLIEDGFDKSEINQLWTKIGSKYFVRYTARQIAWHTSSILSQRSHSELLVSINDTTHKAGTELLIYGTNRSSMFAQVASVLDSRNCSIHDAQIITNKDGTVFDVFTILNHDSTRISASEQQQSLIDSIVTQLDKTGVEHLNTRKLPRRMKHLNAPTKIRFFQPREKTLLELESLDVPGLLASISRVFVEADIHLHMAKITTIGERAEDTFIITNAQSKALSVEQQVALKQLILQTLD